MKTFDVQSIELNVSQARAFSFIAQPQNLPLWALAFQHVSDGRARLRTPNGEADIGLEVNASAEAGTVDWFMYFPDGSVGRAYSRVVPDGDRRSLYSFTLTTPSVPLEQLEGALNEQSRTLSEELRRLRAILDGGCG